MSFCIRLLVHVFRLINQEDFQICLGLENERMNCANCQSHREGVLSHLSNWESIQEDQTLFKAFCTQLDNFRVRQSGFPYMKLKYFLRLFLILQQSCRQNKIALSPTASADLVIRELYQSIVQCKFTLVFRWKTACILSWRSSTSDNLF